MNKGLPHKIPNGGSPSVKRSFLRLFAQQMGVALSDEAPYDLKLIGMGYLILVR